MNPLHGWHTSTTTITAAPLVVVNGSIVKEIGI